jgi:HSP20 family protein
MIMAETATKLPVKDEGKERAPASGWQPWEGLRQEMERTIDDLRADFGGWPFRRGWFSLEPGLRRDWSRGIYPAVDVVEKDDSYEVSAELPGMAEKDIEVKFSDGMLSIKGEKSEEREEKRKDYHLSERRYGSFQRSFAVPEDVDPEKLEATFKNGVLRVVLPKSPEARKKERNIPVTAAK